MNPDLQHYIEQTILPQYDAFDGGHRRDHALTVIRQALDTTSGCVSTESCIIYTPARL